MCDIYNYLTTKISPSIVEQCIIPFTVEPASPILLRDIRSFTSDMGVIINFYLSDQNITSNIRTLYQDLYTFIYELSFSHRRMVTTVARNYLKYTERVTHSSPYMTCIRILLARITPEQRTQFINDYIIRYLEETTHDETISEYYDIY